MLPHLLRLLIIWTAVSSITSSIAADASSAVSSATESVSAVASSVSSAVESVGSVGVIPVPDGSTAASDYAANTTATVTTPTDGLATFTVPGDTGAANATSTVVPFTGAANVIGQSSVLTGFSVVLAVVLLV